MSDAIELNYWVRGEGIKDIRIVTASPRTRINELKAAISSNHPNSLAPSSMRIYQVPIERPILLDSKEDLLSLSALMLGPALLDPQVLSNIFTSPNPDQIHLIISLKTLSVHCWFRGSNSHSSIAIHLECHQSVDDLKEMVAKHTPASVRIPGLRLWKIYDLENLEEVLDAVGQGEPLRGDLPLEKAFEDVCFCGSPSVVVGWVEERAFRPLPSMHPSTMNLFDTASADHIHTARAAYICNSPAAAPSASAESETFKTWQEGVKCIPCGRPQEADETIPTTLLHPVFGQFFDDCQSIEVTATDHRLTLDLMNIMSKLHGNEQSRIDEVTKSFVNWGIGLSHAGVPGTRYTMDGAISLNGHYYVIAEFKNEVGSTGADPYFEAIAYYLECTRKSALNHPRSTLPCFLLNIFGPYIAFSGAAWNLRPTAQPLSTVAFHFHSTDSQSYLTAVRHLAAFRKATETLRQYYNPMQNAGPPTTAKYIFPYPTSYRSLPSTGSVSPKEFKFKYLEEVAEQKRIFFAVEEDTREMICVKFVRTYSLDAHKKLADLGHAPSLRGSEKLPGGWTMVVFDALLEFQTLAVCKSPIPSSVFDDMDATLAAFHEAGFVHGDICDVNIMVSKTEVTKFMFVDFDWSGIFGEARYPPHIKNIAIRRLDDICDGGLITKAHDRAMLRYLRNS